MKAKKITGEAPGGKRTPLSELVPLKTPLLIQIFPIYSCNFKCKYCVFSVEKDKRKFISDKISMELELFKKIINETLQFTEKIRVLRFVGMGEPLLHKQLPEMIKYASSKNIFERIEVLTNASLLSKKMSDDLIESGLTNLLVSIQGTSEQKYRDISNAMVNPTTLVESLKYLYEHRKNTQIHVKIIDCALDGPEDEQNFYKMFGDVCDSIGIEYAGPIFPDVNYDGVLKTDFMTKTQFGVEYSHIKICPQPFFSMQINPDGNVVPCYSIDYPEILGNCYCETLPQIWNGEKYNLFRFKMLEGIENMSNTCQKCNIIQHRAFTTDELQNETERLKKIYGN